MKHFWHHTFLTFLALGVMFQVSVADAISPAAEVPKPADCIADSKTAVASMEYGGKTYYFKSQACKDEFRTDPERFSQLYDALLELKAEGKSLEKPKPLDNASEVPS